VTSNVLRAPDVAAAPGSRWPRPDRLLGWLILVGAAVYQVTAPLLGWRAAGKLGARRTEEDAGRAARGRFEEVVLPHLDAAYNLARYLSRDPDAARDIVQDAYLRAFRAFADYRGGNAKAWILAIVRNRHLSWREERSRGAAATAPLDEGDEDPVASIPDEGDPERALLARHEAEAVRGVLETLPEAAREILVLRDFEDLSYRDIAAVLDLPLGTVMSRLSRARELFAARWRALDAPEESRTP
jgi:RNA polymerase sigma-70 factor (ECF subfamily)